MKLSIIVPIYNADKYLAECLDSILNQTFTDYELILVNDGSTDNSINICRNYQMKDSRIIVVDKENGGVSSARNLGLTKAQGEYIGFVDSDDYIDESMYSKLYNAATQNQADIVICKRVIPNKQQNYGHGYPKNTVFTFENNDKDWKELYYNGDIETFVTNKIFKKDFILNNNIKFEKYGLFEDRLFLADLYLKNPRLYYIDAPLYFYRAVKGSAVRRYCSERYEIVKKIYEKDRCLNSKFDNNIYILNINQTLINSILSCIYQEKTNQYAIFISKIKEIQNSKEFRDMFFNIEQYPVYYKRRKIFKCLKNNNYFFLYIIVKSETIRLYFKKILNLLKNR